MYTMVGSDYTKVLLNSTYRNMSVHNSYAGSCYLSWFFLFFVKLSEKMGSSLDMSRFLSSSCQHVVKRILAYTLFDASYPFLLFFCCGCRHSINIVFAWKMKSHSISNSSILINIILNEGEWSQIETEQNLTQAQLAKKNTHFPIIFFA